MKTLSQSNPQFFDRFSALNPKPSQIYFEGSEEILKNPYIAIVGAREAHPWVFEWMDHELTPVLSAYSLGVVSGGARGVDQWAHSLALRCGQPTLIVLPSGLAEKYPRDLVSFCGHEQVGFLSEYPPNQLMKKHFFWRRNLLIAAVSPLTLVIQAAEKSGTMVTALGALSLGKTLAALPAAPQDARMTGNNALLFSGACMVRNHRDLAALVESLDFS
jgi:DNA processing protein